MKTTITKALAAAVLLATVGAAPLMAQAHQSHEHGGDAPRAGMMMHQMMEAMTTIHETLTPEQREALHEQMESGMHRMMHGGEDGEDGEHRSMMMRGMMGSHAADCPMMGGDQEDHAQPGHPDEG